MKIIDKEKLKINYKNNKKVLKSIIIIIIFVISIFVLFCGYSMAKLFNEVIIKGNAEISEPILVVENNPAIDITALNNKGTYTFKIKNYNEENKISQIDLKYYIEIMSNIDEAINIELYEGEKNIKLNNNKTEYIQISKDKKEEREYKIIITYNKNETNSMSDILEKIQVRVHTEQVKA